MTGPDTHRTTTRRRAAALLALAAVVAALGCLCLTALRHWPVLIAGLVTLAVLVVASWYALSRRGAIRAVAVAVAVAAVIGFVAVTLRSESVRVVALTLALAAFGVAAARYALRPAGPAPVVPAPAARHPVLLMNPRSGGGKATRFGLVERCRALGVRPIVLGPDDDLIVLAKEAVAGGADLLGMAGGDGSQALVAAVASAAGVPFVVVPAGTRNHFALDLGIDRVDVPAALEAFRDGVDVAVDLAEVNGRTFVNNAAMGVYGKVVQSSGYRDAKLQTAAAILPDLIGPDAVPSTLRVTSPSGQDIVPGQLLLVSNNPYQLGQLAGGTTRQRLDDGVLGIAALTVTTAAEAEQLAALELTGLLSRFSGWQEWRAVELEVRSSEPVEVGVDGEALVLPPPLRFVSRPGALTVRLPRAVAGRATGDEPDRDSSGSPTALAQLWRVAFGRAGGAS